MDIASGTDTLETVYLDTETTGLSGGAAMVEVAVVDDDGAVLINTRVNPGHPIPEGATRIHGITDADVRDAPSVAEADAMVAEAVRGKRVVIYNAAFDTRFVNLDGAASVLCAMELYAVHYGDWSRYHGSYTWQPLGAAAADAGHVWTGNAHGALADALACRTVWRELPRLRAEKAASRAERVRRSAEADERQRVIAEAEAGWVIVDADRTAADKTAVTRARAHEESVEGRRLTRLRQAVKGFVPLLADMSPTAEDLLAGRANPTDCVSRGTVINEARRLGVWRRGRGWRAGSWKLTPELAEAVAERGRKKGAFGMPRPKAWNWCYTGFHRSSADDYSTRGHHTICSKSYASALSYADCLWS